MTRTRSSEPTHTLAEAAPDSPATTEWAAARGRLLGIAYRMLGDLGEAEDVVSEVALDAVRRERDTSAAPVESWQKWLTTVCVRRSIDRVRRLAGRREEYPGNWMPEPLATGRLPEDAVAGRDLLGIAVLHLAERLSPDARAALVLSRAFALSAPEIGVILDRSPASVRQLISRAERRLRESGISAEVVPALTRDDAALRRLADAIADGDLETVIDLLAPDAVLWSDGGGVVRAALNPVRGADRIARFFVGIRAKTLRETPGTTVGVTSARLVADDALVFHHGERHDVLVAEFDADGRIAALRMIANPDKLTRAG